MKLATIMGGIRVLSNNFSFLDIIMYKYSLFLALSLVSISDLITHTLHQGMDNVMYSS